MTKPPVIKLEIVEHGKRDPKWNYAKFTDISGKNMWLEPCCLKSKPCWECK